MEHNFFNGKPIYTLTDIGNSLHSVISRTYTNPYYIKAEIIKLNFYPRSGHCYPELVEKEGGAVKTQMRAIIWSAQYQDINARFIKITGEPIKEGISILCLATIEFSAKYGLSLYIQDIEPTFTMGEMARNKMEVINRLKKENVFSLNKEKKLPLVPKRLAVISIDTSKGYNDFKITLENNNRNFKFDYHLFPSLLQGEKAVGTILNQLDLIEKQLDRFDCVVIIRGGGGDAGLNCYDQYELAHRIATFPIPVISGIGHSTNETITESVSYANKITPTEVAYFLIRQLEDFYQKIIDYQTFINNKTLEIILTEKQNIAGFEVACQLSTQRMLHRETQKLSNYRLFINQISYDILNTEKQRLAKIETFCQHTTHRMLHRENENISNLRYSVKLLSKKIIDKRKYQVDNAESLIHLLAKQSLTQNHSALDHISSKLTLLDPAKILKRGFSVTYLKGKPVTDVSQLQSNDEIETHFYRGRIKSNIK